MNRDELLERLAMELGDWPDDISSVASLPPDWMWVYSGTSGRMRVVGEGKGIIKTDWLAERERLINRPSWEDAPEWAEWLIQQSGGGIWYWAEFEPVIDSNVFWRGKEHDGVALRSSFASHGAIPAGHDWRETLEQRPTLTTSLGASEQPYCPMLDSEIGDIRMNGAQEVGAQIMNEAVAADGLDDYFDNIGLPANPAAIEDLESATENLEITIRALKLLLVSGNLDRTKLAQAVELAKELK